MPLLVLAVSELLQSKATSYERNMQNIDKTFLHFNPQSREAEMTSEQGWICIRGFAFVLHLGCLNSS